MDAFSTKARLAHEAIDNALASNSWVQATTPEALQVLKEKYLVEAYDSLRSKGGEHYRQGAIQPIDFIMSQNLDFPAGNVVKYVSRAGKKDSDPLEDLRKARWYLDREISVREKA